MRTHSRIVNGLDNANLLERSLLFAELSNIAYFKETRANDLANQLGFTKQEFFNRDGSQAFLFQNENDAAVVCRGTEPNEWNDIKADIDAVSVVAETIGRVHRGFKKEVG